MTSYRRTHDGEGKQLSAQDAGASGAGDHGFDLRMWANLGELAAWLQEDLAAMCSFATWYNETAARLGSPKRVTSDDVLASALDMFYFASNKISQALRERDNGIISAQN